VPRVRHLSQDWLQNLQSIQGHWAFKEFGLPAAIRTDNGVPFAAPDSLFGIFNQERPHQAIGMKYPAELYVSSSRPYKGLADLEYPFHDRTITVSNCGRICIGRRKINLSIVFAGQNVGIKEVSDKVRMVSFMQYDLGFFDHETGRVTSAENPIDAKVLPMCPARNKPLPMWSVRTP